MLSTHHSFAAHRWVNNCVGVGNHKLFLQFLLWVFLVSMYALVLVIAKYVMCIYDDSAAHCNAEIDQHLVVIFLCVESVLFGLFTLCMLGDQLSSIASNQTQIDRLKNTRYKQQAEVNEVFGSPSHVLCAANWLHPTAVHFPDAATRSVILGYLLEGTDQEGDELAPLMAAAGASFTSSSPLHPHYTSTKQQQMSEAKSLSAKRSKVCWDFHHELC